MDKNAGTDAATDVTVPLNGFQEVPLYPSNKVVLLLKRIYPVAPVGRCAVVPEGISAASVPLIAKDTAGLDVPMPTLPADTYTLPVETVTLPLEIVGEVIVGAVAFTVLPVPVVE
jgi:hypothetical protein